MVKAFFSGGPLDGTTRLVGRLDPWIETIESPPMSLAVWDELMCEDSWLTNAFAPVEITRHIYKLVRGDLEYAIYAHTP